MWKATQLDKQMAKRHLYNRDLQLVDFLPLQMNRQSTKCSSAANLQTNNWMAVMLQNEEIFAVSTAGAISGRNF